MKVVTSVLGGLAVAGCLALSAAAQSAAGSPDTAAAQAATTPATGQKPLEMKSNEGFWGHMNPMARKKWVNRQTEPIKGRLNELDELTAKNANDIRDLDARATAGIKLASDTANTANVTATDASNRAGAAQSQAQAAKMQADSLNGTVSNLDQYKPVTDAELHFRAGSTALGTKSKAALDEIAAQLSGQKGYIVQVQGFSHTRGTAGVEASQQMADSVVRYLVEKKNVPLYRIYKMGYGSARPADVTIAGGSVVQVTLMQNSLSNLSATSGLSGNSSETDASPIGATQPATTAATQPAN